MKTSKTALALAIASSSILLNSTVEAQDSGLMLEEVVVTAQKRAESIQDIAASVTAVQGEALQEYNVFDFAAVEQMTAGLTLSDSSAKNQTMSLRGMTYDSEGTANPVVDAYWNGVPVRPDVAFNQLFDIDRIEVLRGPQGTLQGQTSPGGAVVINTRKADTAEFMGQIQATVADNDRLATQAGVNIPIIENKLAVRIAGNFDESELNGIENHYTGTTQEGENTAGRISVAWDVTDTFTADLVYEYANQELNDFRDMTGSDLLGNPNPDLDKYDRIGLTEADNSFEKTNKLTLLEMNWDMSDTLQLTSISGFQNNESEDVRDLDRSNAVPGELLVQAVTTEVETFTQEVRISTVEPAFGRWDYIVGGFYKDQDLSTDFYRGVAAGSPLAIHAPAIPSDREEFGIFNHNTVDITDVSRIQVGLRWSKIRSLNRYDFDLIVADSGEVLNSFSSIPDEVARQTNEKVTGSLKYLHDIGDNLMAYASYDTSYRPGGVTVEPRLTEAEDLIYGEESSWSFEVGFKSTLWDQRMQLNASVYYQEFDDYINRATGVLVDTSGDGTGDTRISGVMFNGDAIISGVDFDVNVLLTENWTAGGGITYVDANYDGAEVPCDGQPGDYTSTIYTCSSDGAVGDEPPWSATARSEYVVPMGGLETFVRGLYKFNGNRVNTNIENVGGNGTTGSYGLFSLYAGLRDAAGVWEASIWSTNLFDKEAEKTKNSGEVLNGAPTGYRQADVVSPRAIGFTARYNF
ncbi:MAG: TonB-dependent receptor plug domain-containing protein [Halioglobus sp.]